MAKHPLTKQATIGTWWFVALFVIAGLSAFTTQMPYVIYLIAGICGAMVGIYNIKSEEETGFLLATVALILIVISWFAVLPSNIMVANFFNTIIIGVGAAGFITAISLIVKLGVN